MKKQPKKAIKKPVKRAPVQAEKPVKTPVTGAAKRLVKKPPVRKPKAVFDVLVERVKKSAAGRPVKFTHALADRILDGLAGGSSLSALCEDESLPCRQTVAGWVRRGASGNDPDLQAFAVGFVLACNVRVALLEDDFIQLVSRIRAADKVDLMSGDGIRFKLEMDALKWYLARYRQRTAEVEGFEDLIRKVEKASGLDAEITGAAEEEGSAQERLTALRLKMESEAGGADAE